MNAKRPYHKRPKRIGRGVGSGHGKTSTKGHKGQRARSGFHQRAGFEGGQNPMYRRVPKRGFSHEADRKNYSILNLDKLSLLNLDEITPEKLLERGAFKKLRDGIKILGRGKLTRPLVVHAHRFSDSAKAAIEKAGGRVVLLKSFSAASAQKAKPNE